MGTDCRAILSFRARADEIGMAVGILLGRQPRIVTDPEYPETWWVKVPGVSVGSAYRSRSIAIEVRPKKGEPLFGGVILPCHFALYPESYAGVNEHGVPEYFGLGFSGRAEPLQIALCHRLVEIFGGVAIDSDATFQEEISLRVEPPWFLGAVGGEGFQRLQRMLLEIRPITLEDLRQAWPAAAYKRLPAGVSEQELEVTSV